MKFSPQLNNNKKKLHINTLRSGMLPLFHSTLRSYLEACATKTRFIVPMGTGITAARKITTSI
jgi:prefoldin subunit 5